MIKLDNVSKVFGTGVAGLSDVTLSIENGEFVFLVGHTGSGKTTLLRLLIGETTPTTGNVYVGDVHLNKLSAGKIPHYRKKLGIVFQDLKLLMDRTILENILLPLEINGMKMKDAVTRAEELLDDVGILQHKEKFPIQLSGGELQRAAIARALTLSPEVLLADEPTGNLDTKTAFDIVELLTRINEKGTTIIMATHNLDILKKYPKNRLVTLAEGKLVEDNKKEKEKEIIPIAALEVTQVINKEQKDVERKAQPHKEGEKKAEKSHHGMTHSVVAHDENKKNKAHDTKELEPIKEVPLENEKQDEKKGEQK